MVIVVIIGLLLLAFFVLAGNQDPCTTQVTSCLYNHLKANGIVSLSPDLVHVLLVALLIGALWQMYVSRMRG